MHAMQIANSLEIVEIKSLLFLKSDKGKNFMLFKSYQQSIKRGFVPLFLPSNLDNIAS